MEVLTIGLAIRKKLAVYWPLLTMQAAKSQLPDFSRLKLRQDISG